MRQNKKELAILFVVNIPVILFYYFLYKIPGLRPYANIVYFFALLIAGYFLGKDFIGVKSEARRLNNIDMFLNSKAPASTTMVSAGKQNKEWIMISGIFLMVLIFGMMRLSYFIATKIPKTEKLIDLSLWQYFVQPWHNINIFLSVISVAMIVVSVELFYRLYVQNTFNLFFSQKVSILFAALISGLRAVTLGPISGFVDFVLAVIWGAVYYRSGFFAAVIVHMVWDVLFVYFPG